MLFEDTGIDTKSWMEEIGERKKRLIKMGRNYVQNNSEAGILGHITYLLIAKMAKQWDEYEAMLRL